MLSDEIKDQIQEAYRAVLQRKGFRARRGQREMIAAIARMLAEIPEEIPADPLAEKRICAIEAGTGTGKTLAYLLAALPIALARKKKLIISTATVILQEQLVQRDLPDLMRSTGMPFHFTIAKGRGRYLCTAKLHTLLNNDEMLGPAMTLFEDELALKLEADQVTLYQELLRRFEAKEWDGDRDSWSQVLDAGQWQPITTDHRQCTARQCAYYKDCSYFQAKRSMTEADVIVANHDLVLSDLALGGGALLAEPKDAIYVFDEAHHLPDKALSHFNYQIRLRSSKQWTEQTAKSLGQIAGQWKLGAGLAAQFAQVKEIQKSIDENLVFALSLVSEILPGLVQSEENLWRFPHGLVPDDLRVIAGNLAKQYASLLSMLEQLCEHMVEKAKEDIEWRTLMEQHYPALAQLVQRCEAILGLWQSYARIEEGRAQLAPMARWINGVEAVVPKDYELRTSPITAADMLPGILWSKCFAVVLTSATLSVSNQFERAKMRMGLPDSVTYLLIPSPFNYQEQVRFDIPRQSVDPREGEAYTQYLGQALNGCINPKEATLVLFTARQQLRSTYALLDAGLKEQVLQQDDYSKQQLVARHCERVDQGQGSIIFGLASLAEGIDLPGNYLKHVIITKLPFTVPSDPVEAALAEWLTDQGRNPFWEINVPDAAIRLKQACGRLMRSEKDSGQITLLDRRILSKAYGRVLLDSLPDYRRLF